MKKKNTVPLALLVALTGCASEKNRNDTAIDRVELMLMQAGVEHQILDAGEIAVGLRLMKELRKQNH